MHTHLCSLDECMQSAFNVRGACCVRSAAKKAAVVLHATGGHQCHNASPVVQVEISAEAAPQHRVICRGGQLCVPPHPLCLGLIKLKAQRLQGLLPVGQTLCVRETELALIQTKGEYTAVVSTPDSPIKISFTCAAARLTLAWRLRNAKYRSETSSECHICD